MTFHRAFVFSFIRHSRRCLFIYNVDDLSKAVSNVELDTSPSILIPHYDEDSATLFLTGRVKPPLDQKLIMTSFWPNILT